VGFRGLDKIFPESGKRSGGGISEAEGRRSGMFGGAGWSMVLVSDRESEKIVKSAA